MCIRDRFAHQRDVQAALAQAFELHVRLLVVQGDVHGRAAIPQGAQGIGQHA